METNKIFGIPNKLHYDTTCISTTLRVQTSANVKMLIEENKIIPEHNSNINHFKRCHRKIM